MSRNRRLITILSIISALLLSGVLGLTVSAQGNLLTNPGFEDAGSYQASGGDPNFNFAGGWNGWRTTSPSAFEWQNVVPDAYPQTTNQRSGNAAQEIGRGGGTFTAAAYQVVNNIPEGAALRATAYVYLDNGTGTDARARIGIGSNAGGNPLGDVKWGPWMRTVNSWQQVSVDRIVPAGSVTVFIYTTQSFPNGPRGTNKIYIDDATLTVVGEGEPEPGNAGGDPQEPQDPDAPTNTPAPPPTPTRAFAPFVQAQGNTEGGELVHIVQGGDTLAAIAVAYGVSLNELRERNNLSSNVLQIGQRLVIREAPEPEPTDATDETSGGDGDAVSPDAAEPTADTSASDESAGGPDVSGLVDAINDAESAADDASDGADEQGVEVAQAADTDVPAPTATSTAAPTATPDVPPTATVPPTIPPTAPVVSGRIGDPVSTEAVVCALFFIDTNQNRIRETGEALLPGGVITLFDDTGAEVATYETTGSDEPYCFEALTPGDYSASATAPAGYGLTTPGTLFVSVQPGTSFQIIFGAAEGVEIAAVPTVVAQADDPATGIVTETADTGTDLTAIAGLIVIGLAGVVLVGGLGVAFIARRL